MSVKLKYRCHHISNKINLIIIFFPNSIRSGTNYDRFFLQAMYFWSIASLNSFIHTVGRLVVIKDVRMGN